MRKTVCLLGLVCLSGCGGGDSTSQSAPDESYETVYIDDGAVQCESPGLSEEESAQVLLDEGIDVISSACGYLTGVEVQAQCGLGDSNINLHEIHTPSLPDAEALGFESVVTLKRASDPGYEVIECAE